MLVRGKGTACTTQDRRSSMTVSSLGRAVSAAQTTSRPSCRYQAAFEGDTRHIGRWARPSRGRRNTRQRCQGKAWWQTPKSRLNTFVSRKLVSLHRLTPSKPRMRAKLLPCQVVLLLFLRLDFALPRALGREELDRAAHEAFGLPAPAPTTDVASDEEWGTAPDPAGECAQNSNCSGPYERQRCAHRGCNMDFTEADNHPDACCYHPAKVTFAP